mgnify:CR=1 FL=1
MTGSSERFSGFPAGRLTFTPLPSVFFSRVLPQIDDLAELKVTLHLFWLLHHKKGESRYARWEELVGDRTLVGGLGAPPESRRDALAQALERAVARGTVLHVALESADGVENLYFLNTDEGRRAVARARRGELIVARPRQRPPLAQEVGLRPLLAEVYEQRIGLLTPAIAAALAEADRDYGTEWVLDAIAEAVRYEKRRWPYIKSILENRKRRAGGAAEYGEED